MDFKIAKIAEDQRLVFGFASVAATVDGVSVEDSQGDVIPAAVLEKAAYDYVLRSRDASLSHERRGVARLVESFVVTEQKLEAMGLSVAGGSPAGLWVGFKVDNEDVWKDVKSGKLSMFSIGGTARRREAA